MGIWAWFGLILAATTTRLDPHDALVSRNYASLAELPAGATVGTSSLRRKAQLLKLRPDLRIENLRGNLDTRLRKLEITSNDYLAYGAVRALILLIVLEGVVVAHIGGIF